LFISGVELPMGQVFKVLSVEAIHNLSLGQTLSIDVVIYSNLSLPVSWQLPFLNSIAKLFFRNVKDLL